jgi:hypothetical protein
MKHKSLKPLFRLAIALFAIVTTTISCSKKNDKPDTNPPEHSVDSRLVGTWIWTSSGEAGWYDDNGVYTGPSYGLAERYEVREDGTGSSFSHLFSTIGAGTSLEVNIASQGFFESDDEGHFGYFPLSGTYKSTSGENRNLRPDELYDPVKGEGKVYLYQKLEFKTIDGKKCFEVTSSDGVTDRYYKVD